MLPLRTYDYRAFDAPFQAAIPPGAVVLAEPTYWLALRDHPDANIWDLKLDVAARRPRHARGHPTICRTR